MKEDENKIRVNSGAKHFDIPPKSEPINLRSEARSKYNRPREDEMEFFKKRNSMAEAEESNMSDNNSSVKKEKSGGGFLGRLGIRRFSQKAPQSRGGNYGASGIATDSAQSMEPTKLGRIFDKAISGIIYLLVFSLPLFILPFSMEIYEFNKTILLFIFSSLAFLLWIIKMVLVEKRLTFVRTPLDVPIAVFVLLVIISTAFSLDKVSSVLGFYGRFSDSLLVYLSLAMLYFVVVNNIGNYREKGNDMIDNILKIFLMSAFVVVISALLYSFGFKFIPWQEAGFRSFNLVAGSANILGIYLVAVILVSLSYLGGKKHSPASSPSNKMPLLRNFMAALIIMSVILLAIIDFMAAWIVLAVSLMAAMVLSIASRFHSPKGTMEPASRNNSFIFSFSIFLVSLVFILSSLTAVNKNANSNFASSLISSSIKSRILSSGGGQAESDKFTKEVVLDKKTAAAVAVEGLKSDPVAGIIGSGPGTYLYNFSKFKPAEFNSSAFWNIRFDKAGSEILEKISTIGIVGALSYLTIIFLAMGMFLKSCLRRRHSGMSPASAMEPIAMSPSSVYIFSAWFALLLFQFLYLSSTTTTFIFWLFTAILAGEYRMSLRAERGNPDINGSGFSSGHGDINNGIASSLNYPSDNFTPRNDIEKHGCFVLNLRKERSALYPSLLAAAVLLISFSASYYYQVRFYQAEAAYKDISVKQNKTLEGVNLDNQRAWEILDQKANNIKSAVIEKNPYRGEYKAYLSDIYLQKTGIAFQEENGKSEDEKNTQKIALEAKNAIGYLKDAADSNPNNIIFQHKMGSTYLIAARELGVAGAGDWAIKKFNRAIELEPTNPVLYAELGKVFNLTDQVDLAIDQFKKALGCKADYIDAGLQLGLSYEKKEEKEKAIDVLSSLGSVERIQSAVAAGQTAASANLDMDIAFQLGRIYYNSGEISPAKDIFMKIIKINPNHSNARYSLGLIYLSEGDKEKALKEFEAVLLLNPDNEDVKKKIDELKKGAAGDNDNFAEEVNNPEEETGEETQ